ncbi:Putative formate dehydrogenase subunit FdhD [Candidatus Promineifilum breve]|uniref:Sulfur carrier protein FdhD n=1 Tax=Candidatus Promineifilum breve TaxID=1806508 RepID=A0A160T3T0_9CHLR|nr:formate dehydrogenase accessory sulfurtransferase FdhD [Candidatus Promineifilum breve]CUS03989.2 Putative formate dehydrogenase subunit FdhD [Candidatus Promineifilum breve]
MTENATNPIGVRPARYISLNGGEPLPVDGLVIEEALTCISVNGAELATFMCTPRDLTELALGFLYNEGVIDGLDDVRAHHLSKGGSCVDVWLHNMAYRPPRRAIITAGCGGGLTFDDLSGVYEPLTSDLRATPAQLAGLMRQLHLGAELYQAARGVHTAMLADPCAPTDECLLLQVEDIGRHNCLDKLQGAALLAGIATKDRVLLSSGRISSEMINKARRLETPIVCSRTSPTGLSVALAEAWNITIVAYIRQDRMRVYTHPERVLSADFADLAD